MFFSFPPDFLDLCGGALILIQHELGDLIKLDGGKMFFGGKDWSFWGKGSEIIKKVSELKFLKMSKRGSWGHQIQIIILQQNRVQIKRVRFSQIRIRKYWKQGWSRYIKTQNKTSLTNQIDSIYRYINIRFFTIHQIFVVYLFPLIFLFPLEFPPMNNKSKAIQIIKDRLYWISDSTPPKNLTKAFYFNIDDDLEYEPFYLDFGPLNLGKMWKYVTELQKLLAHPEYKKNQIYHYTSNVPQKAANAAFLMGAFQMIILGYNAQKAHEPFKSTALKPFRDASYNNSCSYKCTLLDCLRGLDYALKLKWFDHRKFNLNEYQHYEKVQNGDLNWIVPNKFVAFSSPYDKPVDKYGNRVFTPADYVPVFKKLGVTMVIRLNNHTYDAKGFIKEGIKHHDLIFPDGTPPPIDIVDKFLDIVENEPGAVAVHCKAGLGRTGSLIACYSMKHYRFPAADFIAWIRIARPGSILGPQQHFLIEIEKKMFDRSAISPIWKEIRNDVQEQITVQKLNNLSLKSVEMNEKEKDIIRNGDIGQGENLVEAKMKQQQMKNGNFGKERRSSSKASSKNSSSTGSPYKKQEKKYKF